MDINCGFSPEVCAVRIDQLVRAGSLWLASAQSAGDEVGLLWTERIADRGSLIADR